MLRDRVSWLFIATILAAAGLATATRSGVQLLYERNVADVFVAAQPSVTAVAREMSAPIDAPGSEDRVLGDFGDAAAAGIDAFAPLVRTSRLRGTFFEEADASAYQEATAVESELEVLAALTRDHAGLALVAYRARRVLERVPETGGLLAIDAADQAHTEDLWQRAYAKELRQMDADFQGTVNDADRWRTEELPAVGAAGRWQDARHRLDQFRSDVDRMTDRVRSLPVPPRSAAAGRAYLLALEHLDHGLAALDDYASKSGADPAPLQASADSLAAYRAEREQPLAAL